MSETNLFYISNSLLVVTCMLEEELLVVKCMEHSENSHNSIFKAHKSHLKEKNNYLKIYLQKNHKLKKNILPHIHL